MGTSGFVGNAYLYAVSAAVGGSDLPTHTQVFLVPSPGALTLTDGELAATGDPIAL